MNRRKFLSFLTAAPLGVAFAVRASICGATSPREAVARDKPFRIPDLRGRVKWRALNEPIEWTASGGELAPYAVEGKLSSEAGV